MEGTLIHGRTGTGLNERTVAISGNHVQCAMAVQVLPSNNSVFLMSAPSEFESVLGFSLACREARPPGACRLGPILISRRA